MKRRLLRIRVTITDLAPGGFGVAHAIFENEKRAVFIARSAPGDELDVDADFSTRPARATIASVVRESAARVPSPCAFADTCGGCDYMHIAPKLQETLHLAHVVDALRDVTTVAPAFTFAPEKLRVRTRARLHLESRKNGSISCGFFAEQSREIVDVTECIALVPALERARASLSTMLAGSKGEGEATLALGAFDEPRRAVLSLLWRGELSNDAYQRIDACTREGTLAGAHILENGAARAARIGDPTPWALGADGAPIELAPGGFSQATDSPDLARVVTSFAARALEGRSAPKILELYAGAGNFTVALAKLGKLTAVESSADASECARKNLRTRDLSAKIVCADAAIFTADQRFDLVVLDPPRTGAKDVCNHLLAEPAKSIVYVSCDPQTLARDAKILAAHYAIVDVHALECFPMTSHVETVVRLTRRNT